MNSNRRTLILARRVIQQRLADRRTLALMIVVPVILLSFMGILIRHEPGKLVVGVVNQDQGITLAGATFNLGDRLLTVLDSFEEFDTQPMTAADARRKLNAGDADAVITVPDGFTQQVSQTRRLALSVAFEGSNPMIADRLNKLLERVALQAANAAAVAGSPIPTGDTNNAAGFETRIESSYVHGGAEYDTLDYMAPAMLGFFVFFFVFLLTCISFLRERVAGTLERLQATPIRPLEIIVGYMLGFLVFGLLQGAVMLLFTVFALDIHYAGNLLNIFVVEALLVVLSVNLGIFLSTFAQNEFQVLQFMPLIVVSQGLLGGMIWQVDDMPGWLQPVSRLMPLTYANDALRDVMIQGETLLDAGGPVLIVFGFAVLFVLLAARAAGRAKI
jgi:ABC-2 type transport system permease protein